MDVSNVEWGKGTIPVLVDKPEGAASTVVVLGHGAGGGMGSPFMQRIAEALVECGLEVVRFDFPYMAAGRRSPGRPQDSEAAVRAVADAVRGDRRLVLGGKSYGGRMASHIVADSYPADALVFLGYPLHAPGRMDSPRDEHLYRIGIPMLFLQGTRDSFADSDVLEATINRLPTATLVDVVDADHSFAVRGREMGDVMLELASHVASFIESLDTPAQ